MPQHFHAAQDASVRAFPGHATCLASSLGTRLVDSGGRAESLEMAALALVGHASTYARELGGPWHSDAGCRRDEAGLFFAPSKEPTAARLSREQAAKQVCADCPVVLECCAYALLRPEPYGVWGGLTAAERRVVLARRRVLDAEAATSAAGAVGPQARRGRRVAADAAAS